MNSLKQRWQHLVHTSKIFHTHPTFCYSSIIITTIAPYTNLRLKSTNCLSINLCNLLKHATIYHQIVPKSCVVSSKCSQKCTYIHSLRLPKCHNPLCFLLLCI
ncbi:hypothetical protein KIW84_051086 [Lathyrus oleraceus]|uniref:Uncharacterized protein n=1 Tax=Pisum sativum TaxID=3888 RepID=A0A9D5AD98_PEA|nr:hypothetical protein KIW84_051086 [Pisum sativum]